jgi:hypothetical protein
MVPYPSITRQLSFLRARSQYMFCHSISSPFLQPSTCSAPVIRLFDFLAIQSAAIVLVFLPYSLDGILNNTRKDTPSPYTMAVLDSCPEVKATIRSEGMSLKEYDDPEVDARVTAQQKTVVKFVECRPGAEFSIRFTISDRLRRRSDYISALVTINGEQEVHTAFYAPRRYPFRDKWTCQVDGIQNVDSQGALLKTFKFAELEISKRPT